MSTVSHPPALATGRGPAPSSKLRKAVFEACGQRAEHASNLWLVHSARCGRNWVLTGDTEFLHFLCVEFDPEVESFDLKPQPDIVRLREEDRKTRFDAIIRFRDGHVECRELKRESEPPPEPEEQLRAALQAEAQEIAAKRHGGMYVRMAMSDMEPFQLRIQNSMRMLRFLLAAKDEPLGEVRNAIALILRRDGAPTRLDALAASVGGSAALAYAAVFQLLQRRHLSLPIDTEALTGASLVERAK